MMVTSPGMLSPSTPMSVVMSPQSAVSMMSPPMQSASNSVSDQMGGMSTQAQAPPAPAQSARVPLKPNQIVVTAEINHQQLPPSSAQQTNMLSPVKQENINSKQQTNCANQYMNTAQQQQQQQQFKWNNNSQQRSANQVVGNSAYGNMAIVQQQQQPQQPYYNTTNNNNPYQSNAYCQSNGAAWVGQYPNGKF